MTTSSNYPPVGLCTRCGETNVKLCACLSSYPATKNRKNRYRTNKENNPRDKMGLEYQLNWWHESFSKPMMRYIVEEQSGSKIIEIHLQTHVNRHTTGYPEELENCFYLPILPEWTETEDNPVVLWEHLIMFHWDLLEEIESLGEGIELVKIVHYVASSISSVQAIDLAQAIVAKKAGSRLANWEFYSRHFSHEKLKYSPEHFSIGPLIADKIEELS